MPEQKIHIVFVVNGQDVPVETNVNAPLRVAIHRALELSGNTGRDPDEWETRNVSGVLLEPTRKVEELGLVDGTRLFVNLRVGAGGDAN